MKNNVGIIPRAIELIGQHGWGTHIKVSYVEIYHNYIRDLLRNENDGVSLDLKHDIKVDSDGRHYITNINMVPLAPLDPVKSFEAVINLASENRTSGSEVSKFVTSVLTLHLVSGNIIFVDLCGSDRISRSRQQVQKRNDLLNKIFQGGNGWKGEDLLRLRNKTLYIFSQVLAAIKKKAPLVPFQDSKLTHLLQPILSGEGMALMIVNLNGKMEDLCSLHFAAHVNHCELGNFPITSYMRN